MSRPVPVRRVTDIARWRAALIGIALLLLTPHVATGETVTIPLPTGEALRAALRLPAAGIEPRHVVIAFHGCAGLGGAAQELRLGARERDWADRLNEAGHPVLFPDSFGSRALPPACGIAHHPAPPAAGQRAGHRPALRVAALGE
jgi:dienelactone hydrolase